MFGCPSVSARTPRNPKPRSFKSGTRPQQVLDARSCNTTSKGWVTVTSRYLLILRIALRVPPVNERGSSLPGSEPREPQRDSWETLPFGLTQPPILQKLPVQGKGGTGTKEIPRDRRAADPPPHMHGPTGGDASATRELGAVSPPAVPGQRRTPAPMGPWERISAWTPPQLTPYFLPLVETASLSLFPATEFMVALPEERV